jgi:hypothetical protein
VNDHYHRVIIHPRAHTTPTPYCDTRVSSLRLFMHINYIHI